MKIAAALGAALLLAGCQTMPDTQAPDFEPTLARHLAAIETRDLGELEATITSAADMLLIFPDGTRLTTRQQFLDFHRQWFADTAWEWRGEVLGTWQGHDYAHVLMRYGYDPDGSGPEEARASYLTLGFRLESGEWRLVHDQNTRITETAGQ